MAAILSTFLMLGVLAGGVLAVIHRCDWLGFCDSNSVSGASAADNGKAQTCNCCTCTQVNPKLITCDNGSGNITSFTNGLSLDAQCQACGNDAGICAGATNIPAKKGSKKKCGCCSCVQTDDKTITCDTGVTSLSFTNGLTLDAQCKACSADPNICANSKVAKQQQLTEKAKTDATINAAGKNVPGITQKVSCTSGFHMNSNNVCVPNGKTQKQDDKVKPNKGGDSPGCRSGETFQCHDSNPNDKNTPLVCSCARYARQSFYAVNNPRPPVFRSHLSF